ncbi:MAG TPA: hypothetical protein VLJ58_21405 [Ramlibacter sp.]|nr:hypothetical protein [Ramlibacter sp.]
MKRTLLFLTAALAVSLVAIGGVVQRAGSPFLYDETNGQLVGIRNTDNSETYFPLYSSKTLADSVAAFSPAAPGAIGGTTPAAGTFTTLTVTSTASVSPANATVTMAPTGTGTVVISPATLGTINKMAIGGTTPAAATVTTLTATSTVSLSPANASVTLSPTGTGTVTISPATAGAMDNMTIGASTPLAGTFTTATATTATVASLTATNLTVSSQVTSSVATGTAPFVVSSTTNVANLNASSLNGATFAAPGTIGGGTPAAATFTTAVTTGTATVASLIVGSTTVLPDLSGTSPSIGGGALLAGACASDTVTIAGSSTAMVVTASPVTYPGDGSYWLAYVSAADTVTVKVCAAVGLTPTASTYRVRVIQ